MVVPVAAVASLAISSASVVALKWDGCTSVIASLTGAVVALGTTGHAAVRSSLDAPAAPGAGPGLCATVRAVVGPVTVGPVTVYTAPSRGTTCAVVVTPIAPVTSVVVTGTD